MTHLTCPVCGDPLTETNRAFSCPRRHSFDIAREGYVNLLPARRKKRKHPGDSRDMLLARRSFLGRGHYRPLADAVCGAVDRHLGDDPAREAVIADIGAGEGWYIGHLDSHLRKRGLQGIRSYGVDLSKDAARLAAKRYRDVTFAVADVWDRLPFGDGAATMLLNIFAPRNAAEFARVLAPGGLLVVVIPGGAHLAELRNEAWMIGREDAKREHVEARLSGTFTLTARQEVAHVMELTGDDLYNLAAMTPGARHVSDEELAILRGERRKVTAAFTLLEFVR